MKKIKFFFWILPLTILLGGFFSQKALAEGVFVQGTCYGNVEGEGLGYIQLWSDKGIITADGRDVLTVYAAAFITQKEKCPTVACALNNKYYRVNVSGEENYIIPQFFLMTNENFPSEFKITSTKAEEKIITIEEFSPSGEWIPQGSLYSCQRIAIKVKFTPRRPGVISAISIVAIPSGIVESAQENQLPTPPNSPTIEGFALGGSKFNIEKINQVKFSSFSKITFFGSGLPNSKITFYINSDNIIGETKTDENGKWSYALEKKLEPGNYSLQIAVTDPQTGLVSEKTPPINFKIHQPTLDTPLPLTNFEYILSSINNKQLVFYNVLISTLIVLVGLALGEGVIMVFNKKITKKRFLPTTINLNKPKIFSKK